MTWKRTSWSHFGEILGLETRTLACARMARWWAGRIDPQRNLTCNDDLLEWHNFCYAFRNVGLFLLVRKSAKIYRSMKNRPEVLSPSLWCRQATWTGVNKLLGEVLSLNNLRNPSPSSLYVLKRQQTWREKKGQEQKQRHNRKRRGYIYSKILGHFFQQGWLS